MTSYRELKEKAAALEAQIEEAREAEFDDALTEVRKLVGLFGFLPDDVFGEKREKPRKQTDKRPKYRNPDNGVEWSGMGREPFWIKGKDRAQFQIRDNEIS